MRLVEAPDQRDAPTLEQRGDQTLAGVGRPHSRTVEVGGGDADRRRGRGRPGAEQLRSDAELALRGVTGKVLGDRTFDRTVGVEAFGERHDGAGPTRGGQHRVLCGRELGTPDLG